MIPLIPLDDVYCEASTHERAKRAERDLRARYRFAEAPDGATKILALGGDGFMLDVLHRHKASALPVYGMNCGTVGFLMNSFRLRNLDRALDECEPVNIFPLKMEAVTMSGETAEAVAVNEVSLLRQTRQAAHIRIVIDERVRLQELAGDGVLLCTPAGSTAYNFSAGGPVIPLSGGVLGLTPLSPFRPRRWRGALVPEQATVVFEALEAEKRPVSVTADSLEIRDVARVSVKTDKNAPMTLLFDKGHGLDERIFSEQFLP